MTPPGAARLLWLGLLASTALSPAALANDLPTGGQVVGGSAQISTPGAGQLTIDQSSNRAVVNWSGFSVGEGAQVTINQPGRDSAILNRVTGSATSNITGQITATGEVFVVNPNGILISPTGEIQAGGGFVASTLDIADEDFMGGRLRFSGNGSSAGVTNQGTVAVDPGGYAALIGGRVRNDGTIRVPLGRVGLGSGERVTLDLSGDGFLQVAVPTDGGDEAEALVQNAGRIEANGGRVEMRAATARNAARHAVNLSGVVEARTVSGRSGAIVLGGGGGGRVTVTGTARASAAPRRQSVALAEAPRPAARSGGRIEVTGTQIALAGATLDASGADGGGTVRIGGNIRGDGPLPTADRLSVDAATTIRADATQNGAGGSIVLWSERLTDYAGHISARGAGDGDGGFAEVSGRAVLRFGGTADLTAETGAFGTLLLDPFNVVIGDENDDVPPGDGAFDPSGDSFIAIDDLEAVLAASNVEITTGTDGDAEGNITLEADLGWSSGSTLSLVAENDIRLNAGIEAQSGGLTLAAGGTVTPSADGRIDVGAFTLTAGAWRQTGPTLAAFEAGDFTVGDGASFLRAVGGNGDETPFELVDVYGLQGMGSADLLDRRFALAADIDASGTAGWTRDGGAGFDPIGGGDQGFSGSFDGRGFTVADLTTADIEAGLFANIAGGTIRGFTLENVDVTGSGAAGALAAIATDATIQNVAVTGQVQSTGATVTGGLVGRLDGGSITGAGSTATVTAGGEAPGNQFIGGLVGENAGGAIGQSFATGDVFASGGAGPGAVRGVGGLVGQNTGTITQSFAEGFVRPTGTGTTHAGGLVGRNIGGDISETYADGRVQVSLGRTDSDGVELPISDAVGGGVVGVNTGTVTDSYAGERVNVTNRIGGVWAGGVVGRNSGTVARVYGDSLIRGWVLGPLPLIVDPIAATNTGTITSAYSRRRGSDFGTALTEAEFSDTEGFIARTAGEGWDFFGVWAPPAPGERPVLYALSPVIYARGEDTEAVYGLPDGLGPLGRFGGGPGTYVFGPAGDSVDLSGLLTADVGPRSNVGTYTIESTANSVQSSRGVSYRVVSSDARFTITPAPLTITALDQNKVYGQSLDLGDGAFTVDGLVNGDAVAAVVLDSAGASADAGVGDGPYAITAGDATGTGLSNYAISYVAGALTVTPAPLTITALDQSKIYGRTAALGGFTVDGLVNGDAVAAVALDSLGAAAGATVAGGPYAITASDATGSGLGNYTIAYAPGTLTVAPAPLTITALDQTKVYGQTAALGGFTVDGLVNGDAVAGVTLDSLGAGATATVAGGPYAITASDATGSGLGNYTIAYAPGTLTVTPAPLTITALDQTKVYGDTLDLGSGGFTVDGLVNGDAVAGVTLDSLGAAAGADVGSAPYVIAAGDATGSGLGNYRIAYVDGALAVTPAPLTIVAGDASKVYGDVFALDGLAQTVVGLRNGDRVTGVTFESAGAAADAQVVGNPYAITAGDVRGEGLVGADGVSNYDITTVDGALTVTPRTLIITADDQVAAPGMTGMTFNGTEFGVSGLVNDDTVTSVALSSDGAAPGTVPGGGAFAIEASDAQGSGIENYEITYVEGTLFVAEVSGELDAGPVPSFGPTAPGGDDSSVLPDGLIPGGAGEEVAALDPADPSDTGAEAASERITVLQQAEDALEALETLSAQLEADIAACRQSDDPLGGVLGCIGNALDRYAGALDDTALDLPESLRGVSAVIRQAQDRVSAAQVNAARRLATATTDAERRAIEREAIDTARTAVREATEEVRKTIALLRAEDPELASVQRAQATSIVGALDKVDSALTRVVGL